MTPSETKFLARVREDKGWAAPAQLRMVRRLAAAGLLTLTDETRYNTLRGTWERKCIASGEIPGEDPYRRPSPPLPGTCSICGAAPDQRCDAGLHS